MEPATAAEQEEEANLLIPPPVPLTTEMDGGDAVNSGVTVTTSSGGGNDRVGGSSGGMVTSMQMVLESKIAPIVEYLNLVMVQKSIFLVFQGMIVMMISMIVMNICISSMYRMGFVPATTMLFIVYYLR